MRNSNGVRDANKRRVISPAWKEEGLRGEAIYVFIHHVPSASSGLSPFPLFSRLSDWRETMRNEETRRLAPPSALLASSSSEPKDCSSSSSSLQLTHTLALCLTGEGVCYLRRFEAASTAKLANTSVSTHHSGKEREKRQKSELRICRFSHSSKWKRNRVEGKPSLTSQVSVGIFNISQYLRKPATAI